MTTEPTTTNHSGSGRGHVFSTSRPRLNARWLLVATIAAALAVDQITKELAVHVLSSGPITLGGLRLHLVANRGILLGFPAPTAVIVLATIGVVVVALRSVRGSGLVTVLAFGLLAGGALGNLVDRFQGRDLFPPGAVVDWISLGRITFNLADAFLIAGAAMLLFLSGSDDSAEGTGQDS